MNELQHAISASGEASDAEEFSESLDVNFLAKHNLFQKALFWGTTRSFVQHESMCFDCRIWNGCVVKFE